MNKEKAGDIEMIQQIFSGMKFRDLSSFPSGSVHGI